MCRALHDSQYLPQADTIHVCTGVISCGNESRSCEDSWTSSHPSRTEQCKRYRLLQLVLVSAHSSNLSLQRRQQQLPLLSQALASKLVLASLLRLHLLPQQQGQRQGLHRLPLHLSQLCSGPLRLPMLLVGQGGWPKYWSPTLQRIMHVLAKSQAPCLAPPCKQLWLQLSRYNLNFELLCCVWMSLEQPCLRRVCLTSCNDLTVIL